MINFENSKISKIFLGNDKIVKMYHGNDIIYKANNYLTFTAEEAGATISLNKVGTPDPVTLEYTTDDSNWINYTIGTQIPLTKVGDKVKFRAGAGRNQRFAKDVNNNYHKFVMTKKIAASGSINTLLDRNDNIDDLTGREYCYSNMFRGCTSLINAPELPATTLASYCYAGMFDRCTSLINAPELPATTLASYCYWSVFKECTGLTTAPELPATTLASHCYYCMFYGCTSLTTAPELSATTLASHCYSNMFRGCTILTNAPELPATTLVDHCYEGVFSECTSLATAPELPATTLASYCYYCMFYECTILTNAPKLPVTTLAKGCYSNMFQGCTSLATAPELPATTLADGCYSNMFLYCTNLSNVSVRFTNWRTDLDATTSWLNGVAQTGTFTCPVELDMTTRNADHVPVGWVIEDTSKKYYDNVDLFYDYANAQTTGLQMKPEFKRCVNEQTDFKDPNDQSNTIWYHDKPLPNPNRSDINSKYVVTSMCGLFGGCSTMTLLDLSEFDTASVTNMKSLFTNCLNLETLNIKRFNTNNVTNMAFMFSGNPKLKNVICDEFTIANNAKCNDMFSKSYASTLFDWTKVKLKSNTLEWAFSMSLDETLDLTNADFSSLTNFKGLFMGVNANKIIGPMRSKFLTPISDFSSMFAYSPNITNMNSIGFPNFETIGDLNLSGMFIQTGIQNITFMDNLGNHGFEELFKNCNHFEKTFKGCNSLTVFDPGTSYRWPTGVGNTIMVKDMFSDCQNLTEANLTFMTTETSHGQEHSFYGHPMFANCPKRPTITLGGYISWNSQERGPMGTGSIDAPHLESNVPNFKGFIYD